MRARFIGWTAVAVCVFSVAMAVIGSNSASPQEASAAPAWANPQARACQDVMRKLDTLQRNALAANLAGRMTAMGAVDYCVAQQAQINMSRCPGEFRMAVARYIAAENALSMDARMNSGNQGTQMMSIIMRAYGREEMGSYRGVGEEMQGDLGNFQNAERKLDEMERKYCLR